MTSHEFMYMNKNVFTFVSILFRAFVKSAMLQNVCTFVIRFFTHKYRGQIMGWLVQRTKLLDHFLNGILVRKRHSMARYQLTECKQRKSIGNFTYFRNGAFTYSPLYKIHKLTLVLH